MNKFIYILTRMSTAIFMLTFLAAASALGTYVLQNRPEEEYIGLMGSFWYEVFSVFDLFNMYASWWFIGLLVLLILSIISCLNINGRIVWGRKNSPNKVPPAILLKEFHKVETKISFEEFIDKAGEQGLNVKVFEGAAFAGESKKYVYGYWAMHVSVLLFCLYGLGNAFFGWRTVMNLAEGDKSNVTYKFTANVEDKQVLPFILKNKDFSIDFYDTGMPKNFETELEVYEEDGLVDKHLLQVNVPYIRGAYSIYQGTFGDAGSLVSYNIRPIYLTNVKSEEKEIKVYNKTTISDFEVDFTNFKLHNVENVGEAAKFGRKLRNLGPSVEYIIRGPNMTPVQLKSYLNHPNIFAVSAGQTDAGPVYANYILGLNTEESLGWAMAAELANKMQEGMSDKEMMEIVKALAAKYLKEMEPNDRLLLALKVLHAAQIINKYELPFLVQLTDYEQKRYSGLQVSYDPFSWLFWLASFVMIFGVYASLYGNWIRVWAYNKNGKLELYIKAHKNEMEWHEKFI